MKNKTTDRYIEEKLEEIYGRGYFKEDKLWNKLFKEMVLKYIKLSKKSIKIKNTK